MEYNDKCPIPFYKLGIMVNLDMIDIDEAAKLVTGERYDRGHFTNFLCGYAESYGSVQKDELVTVAAKQTNLEKDILGIPFEAPLWCQIRCEDTCYQTAKVNLGRDKPDNVFYFPVGKEFQDKG